MSLVRVGWDLIGWLRLAVAVQRRVEVLVLLIFVSFSELASCVKEQLQ